MKKLVKLFVCLSLIICTVFIVTNSKVNKNVPVDAASNLVEVKDDNGNVVYHRNSSEPVMRLKEYNYPTQNLRACWVSNFVGSLPSYSNEEKWKADYTYVLDKMETYGLNCIIFHVRTHNNALYKSELNPVASWFANVNFDEFDPLAWAIEETHKRGIEFHAWLNPYRISTNGGKTQFVSGSIPAVNPVNDSSKLLQSGDSIILNPGIQSNRDFIVDSCMEVVENYDVDAIHFDDYFYISGVETDKSGDWKREQVDLFIEDLSNQIRSYNKEHNKAIQLGISPSGIYQNGGYSTTPKYDSNGNLTSPLYSNTAGFAHYGNYLYSDTLKWINEEWIDYIMPQTYWSLEQTVAQFGSLSRWWSWAVAKKNVNLYLGMGIYMPASNSNWCKNKYEVRDQILNAEMYDEVGGFSFYSYNYLDSSNIYTKTGMDIVKDDYFSKKIPGDVKKYYANIYDTVKVENVQIKDGYMTYDACDNVRGYVVYKVKRGNVLNQENIDHIYYYGTDLSVAVEDTKDYVYYVSSVNLANEISEPVTTEDVTVTHENVIEAINKLPSVIKFEDETQVEEVKALYDVLSTEEQAKVSNVQVLNDAIKLLAEKYNAVEFVSKYKDLDNYTTDTRLLMEAYIASTNEQINIQPTLNDLNALIEEFKAEMDKFLVLSEELAEVIVTAKKTLNDHFATLELEYYESQDQKNLQGLLEDGIEAIDNAKSKGEIEKIVSDAILEMDDTPHFKVEYEAIIKDLEESLKAIIDESIAENSWLESQNLSLKMEVIIDGVKEINKYKVYKNSDDYIEDAKKELNAHISELNDLYEQMQKELQAEIQKQTEVLNNHYNSLDLEHYSPSDLEKLSTTLANALESLKNVNTLEEVSVIVSSALKTMNEAHNFKAEYDAIIKEITDALDAAVNETLAKDEWFKKFDLANKKEIILNNLTKEDKYTVYANSATYIDSAKKELNDYLTELDSLYSAINTAIDTIKAFDTSREGAKALIDEYVEKVKDALDTENVNKIQNEFEQKYNNLPKPEEPKPSSNCKLGVLSFVNLFTVLAFALLILRKK